MLVKRSANERGHVEHGWLESYHSFSFGSYYDPHHTGFRSLRVINEDRVAPGNGFGTHPHNNMEIISYVLEGTLEHKDSMGNGSIIRAGDFQYIAAGTGITHSEFNPSLEQPVHFYQIWITPEREGVAPAYEQREFKPVTANNTLELICSGTGIDNSIRINQDVLLYAAAPGSGEALILPLTSSRYGWLQVVRGSCVVDTATLAAGDGLALSDCTNPVVQTASECSFLFFDLA